ncbi:SIMPL domain-containing protein [Cytophaga aurantiaca]|uniref:SIMPL domain-containing protein n=1 Tax=Cytophaga aurantiaca TaxID=29530 RepID=UPI00037341D8|nr:SIMPL domain-containing protein [Cytophaga aurantiaca]
MKKLITSIIFICALTSVFAQTSVYQKTIAVTGTAEMEVVPDEIYFRVVLKEYQKDKNKVLLEKLEKELTQAVVASGIAKEDFTVEQISGYSWSRKKKDDAELYNSKSFIIKVSTPGKIDEILNKVNAESIYSVEIRNYSHSKIEEYKKQLKIEAIKAAKAKATYLLEAINEKIGPALEVNDRNAEYIGGFEMFNTQVSNNEYRQYGSTGSSYEDNSTGFQKIKLQFQVNATFAIQ